MSTSSKSPVPSAETKRADTPPPSTSRPGLKVAAALIVLGIIAAGVYVARTKAGSADKATVETTTPVAAAKVSRQNLTQDLVFDAEFRPYQEVDLHAKVAGYLE